MQKHEGPREPGNDNRPKRGTTTWWLLVVIFILLGAVAGKLLERMF